MAISPPSKPRGVESSATLDRMRLSRWCVGGRGLLLDVPAALGVGRPEPAYGITVEDPEKAPGGVKFGEGGCGAYADWVAAALSR
jgi:hypothetical protein